ncbi:hypothetical protein AcV5_003895 [Taiwanofungus camphoratus]|nr:hypothetical protein AcV5_003895 [Antrodia cinnamomea]
MSLFASSRSAIRHGSALPQELWLSCFHTSVPCLVRKRSADERKLGVSKKSAPPNAPSRTRLVKSLSPRLASKQTSGILEVAPRVRDAAPHSEVRDTRKKSADLGNRTGTRDRNPERRSKPTHSGSQRKWQDRKPNAAESRGLPDFDKPWRTSKEQLLKTANYGVKEDKGQETTAPSKAQVYNPLSDEFDISVRSVSTRQLPTEFTTPPLMDGLLTSVIDVLGPHARPTPIQALSLKHLFNRPLAGSKPSPDSQLQGENTTQWHQCLLASETGSGKSIAYLLPMLQDLKLSELSPDSSSTSHDVRPWTPLNPRAIVLAPTHELSRQLSGFAKALLHQIKLRVLCVSQANLPSTSKRNVTASKMAHEFDGTTNAADSSEVVLKKKGVRPVDVVVGTPSKILEMVKGRGWDYEQPKVEDTWDVDENGKTIKPRRFTVGKPEMSLHGVEWVVVDEADVLFDPDFQEHTKMILAEISQARGQPAPLDRRLRVNPETLPAPQDYPFHLILSTATIPSALAWYLDKHHPSLVRLASPNLHHLPSTLKTEYSSWTGGNRNADIEQRIRRVWYDDMITGYGKKSKILIFCNKSTKVEDLGRYLKEKAIANVALTSTSDARKRGSNHHLDGFLREHERAAVAEGKAIEAAASSASPADSSALDDVKEHPHVMITTSLLSRGLDFSPSIKHVFIVDEPRNMVDFLHRAGRSGRAGESGKVVVFGKTKGRGSSKAKDMRKKVGALVA